MRQQDLSDRITSNQAQCGGRPCIRGMRIRVTDILEMLADGLSATEILADLPDLEPEDIRASLLSPLAAPKSPGWPHDDLAGRATAAGTGALVDCQSWR